MSHLERSRILIIEDNRIAGVLLKSTLSKALSYNIDWVETLAEAKEILLKQHHMYKLALVDFVLPDAPNGEAIDETVSYDMPTIVFTGKELDADVRMSLWRKNIVDYVIKDDPNSIDYIKQVILRLEANPSIKIVVVDDSRVVRKLFSRLLEVHLYQVFEAEDAQVAENILDEHPDVRLVITDYSMPGMDGFNFVKYLRKRFGRDGMGILGMTSSEDGAMGARFIKCGANDFISKRTFLVEELYSRVNNCLDALEHMAVIRRLATTDSLSGLFNRHYFYERSERLLRQINKESGEFVCAAIDIDHFKSINDSYGHQIGDRAIKAVSMALANFVKKNQGIVGRVGGEEFCIVMSGFNRELALAQLEQLRKTIAAIQIPAVPNKLISVTVSIGLVTRTKLTMDEVMADADKLLYRAKHKGRNIIVADEPSASPVALRSISNYSV